MGGKDRVCALLDGYKTVHSEFRDYILWDHEALSRLLDDSYDIRRSFLSEVTSSDALIDMLARSQAWSGEPIPDYLTRLLDAYRTSAKLARPDVVKKLVDQLAVGRGALLLGSPGLGKTSILAELATTEPGSYLYVSLKGKTLEQVASHLARRLAYLEGSLLRVPGSELEALGNLESQLQGNSCRFLIDDCEDQPAISERLAGIPGFAGRTVFSSTSDLPFLRSEPVVVSPLVREEIRRLVDLLGIKLTPGRFENVAAASEGNPLYLEYFSSSPTQPAPAGLARFSETLLSKAGVIGYEVLHFLAHSLRPLTTEELLELVSEATSRKVMRDAIGQLGGMLINQGRGLKLFHKSFAHFVLSRAEEEGASQHYYGQLATFFGTRKELLEGSVSAIRCGREVPPNQIQAAVSHALLYSRVELAGELLEHNLRHFEARNDPVNLAMTLVGIGEVRRDTSCYSEARELILKAERLLENAEDKAAHFCLRMSKSMMAIDSGGFAQIIPELESLLAGLGEDEPHERAVLLVNLSFAYLHVGRSKDGYRAAGEALDLSEKLGDTRAINSSLANLSACGNGVPELHPNEQLQLADRIIAKAQEIRNDRLAALGFNHRATAQRNLDKPEEAAASSRQAIRLCQLSGAKDMEVSNIANLGNALLDQGLVGEASEAYRESLDLANQCHLKRSKAHAQELLGRVYLLPDVPCSATLELLSEALQVFGELGDQFRMATTAQKVGEYHEKHGRPEEAQYFYVQSAESFGAVEDWGEAAEAFEKAAKMAEALGSEDLASSLSILAARCALNNEDPGGACNLLSGSPQTKSEVTELYGQILSQFGRGLADSSFTAVSINYANHCRRYDRQDQKSFESDLKELAEAYRACRRPTIVRALFVGVLQLDWLAEASSFTLDLFESLYSPDCSVVFFADPWGTGTVCASLTDENELRIECDSKSRTEMLLTVALAIILVGELDYLTNEINQNGGFREEKLLVRVLSGLHAQLLGHPPLPNYPDENCLVTFRSSARPPMFLYVHSDFLQAVCSPEVEAPLLWLLMNFHRYIVAHFTGSMPERITVGSSRAFADRILHGRND